MYLLAIRRVYGCAMAALPDDDGSTARPSLCFRVSLQIL